MIFVHLTYDLAKTIRQEMLEMEVETVQEIVDALVKRYGSDMKTKLRSVTFIVNGININYLHGKKTSLHSGDHVHLVNPAGGG